MFRNYSVFFMISGFVLVCLSAHAWGAGQDMGKEWHGKRVVPECEAPAVLRVIRRRFAGAARRVWHYPVHIKNLDMIVDRGFTSFPPSLIDRRWCQAVVHLSDDDQHRLWYVIERGQGFAGLMWNVEFCVPSYDRWHIYDGLCRALSEKAQAY